ncbi:PHD-finger domain-containing protein [Phthorimaea operculella]|nr:PHD-finger domain-containing protein [Phthorimaea operculella]
MAKCAKCSKVINKRNAGVQCSKCSKWFHGSCASLSTEQLTALSSTDSVDWKCGRCATTYGGKPKRISVILPEPDADDDDKQEDDAINQSAMGILSELRREVQTMRETVREIIREELKDTLKFYSDKIDEYEERIVEFGKRVKQMENQCKSLTNTCKNLELKNDVLEQKLNKLEQSQASDDIEICGIKEAADENVKQTAMLLGQLLNQQPEDVVKVYRKKKPARQGSAMASRAAADSPIVVTLRSGSRDSWLAAAKVTSISPSDLGREVESSDTKVYVRATLSPTTAYLLWKAKSDLKEKSLCKFVWCKNGIVMVRKNEGDKKIYYVRATGDIDIIKKQLMKK